MALKHIKQRLIPLVPILLFINAISFGQSWAKSNDNNSSYLHHLFFQDLKAFFKGPDSSSYVLTSHKPDKYWLKQNKDKSELIVSKITNAKDITLIKRLKEYANDPIIKSFNNKFYLLDNDFKVSKKKYYYNCYVYSSNWELEAQVKIPELPHQRGFSDFVVTKEEELFLLTVPYFIDHKQKDFKGSYLVKYSLSSGLSKNVLFSQSYSSNLSSKNDSLSITLNHQKFVYPYYQSDSVFNIHCDYELNYAIVKAKEFIQIDKKIKRDVLLADGDRIVYIDSSYALSPISWTSTFKISLINHLNIRQWTIEPNNKWIFSTPKPLQNGLFIAQIEKRWDSTCLVLFKKDGTQKSIKSFPMKPNTNIDRYNFIDFFEIKENEIWMFYKKEAATRDEQIYFERLLLWQ